MIRFYQLGVRSSSGKTLYLPLRRATGLPWGRTDTEVCPDEGATSGSLQ